MQKTDKVELSYGKTEDEQEGLKEMLQKTLQKSTYLSRTGSANKHASARTHNIETRGSPNLQERRKSKM